MRETENHLARAAYYESIAGNDADIQRLETARNADAEAAREKIFAPPAGAELAPGAAAAHQAVDIAPVSRTIDEILAGSSGNRPAVTKAMDDAKSLLLDKDGNAIADPRTLYDSTRKGINDLINSKDMSKEYGALAARHLIKVRDALDAAIETKAPGFKNYLSEYEEASGPINAMQFLQGRNVTDATGKITLTKIQGALDKIDADQAARGIKLGKAVTDQQRAALESIRDDLLRVENVKAGMPINSPTYQNAIMDKRLGLSQYIPDATGATLGGGLGALTGLPGGKEIGAYAGERLGMVLRRSKQAANTAAAARVQSTLEEMLLNPERYSTPSTSQPLSLNDILSGPKFRLTNAAINRLAIGHYAAPRR
jgi:hypothetical protein